jgi:hypothetical protein
MLTEQFIRRKSLLSESIEFLERFDYLKKFQKLEEQESNLCTLVQKTIQQLEPQKIDRWYKHYGKSYGPMKPEAGKSNINCIYENVRYVTAVLLVRYSRDNSNNFKWVVENGALIGEVSSKVSGSLLERLVVLKYCNGCYCIYLAWLK